ncbi:MAG: hypothetical protein KKD00_07965 [Gammaproteobacteria bacterium]|nr:hypothetical protein [Gammaproteobacteria bacterium]
MTPAAFMRMMIVVLTAMIVVCVPLQAQQSTQAPAGQDQQSEQQTETGDEVTEEPVDEQADNDQSDNLPDIDNEPIEPGSGGPGRFIPSEQISQDLGVSFPIDI